MIVVGLFLEVYSLDTPFDISLHYVSHSFIVIAKDTVINDYYGTSDLLVNKQLITSREYHNTFFVSTVQEQLVITWFIYFYILFNVAD